jgi:hypothetical protein
LFDSASVATNTRHFEDLSDLRVPDLRTVKCNVQTLADLESDQQDLVGKSVLALGLVWKV